METWKALSWDVPAMQLYDRSDILTRRIAVLRDGPAHGDNIPLAGELPPPGFLDVVAVSLTVVPAGGEYSEAHEVHRYVLDRSPLSGGRFAYVWRARLS